MMFPEIGVPPNLQIFHEMKHPAIGVPPFLETPTISPPFRFPCSSQQNVCEANPATAVPAVPPAVRRCRGSRPGDGRRSWCRPGGRFRGSHEAGI